MPCKMPPLGPIASPEAGLVTPSPFAATAIFTEILPKLVAAFGSAPTVAKEKRHCNSSDDGHAGLNDGKFARASLHASSGQSCATNQKASSTFLTPLRAQYDFGGSLLSANLRTDRYHVHRNLRLEATTWPYHARRSWC